MDLIQSNLICNLLCSQLKASPCLKWITTLKRVQTTSFQTNFGSWGFQRFGTYGTISCLFVFFLRLFVCVCVCSSTHKEHKWCCEHQQRRSKSLRFSAKVWYFEFQCFMFNQHKHQKSIFQRRHLCRHSALSVFQWSFLTFEVFRLSFHAVQLLWFLGKNVT